LQGQRPGDQWRCHGFGGFPEEVLVAIAALRRFVPVEFID